MAAPFLIAIIGTPWLDDGARLVLRQRHALRCDLFMGAAIAITAFPMLARIIHERGLSHTSLGTLSLSAGAIDDAAAWCVLAVVLASFGSGPSVAITAVVGGIVFATFMLLAMPRLLAPLGRMAGA